MNERLRAVGRATCENRGYEVSDPGKPWLPTCLAAPTADASRFVARATNDTVAIEPLDSDEATPTTLLSRLRNNVGNGRFSLFVVESESAARTVHEVVHEPPLVASEDGHGRTFYNGPDRIPLADGGYAAIRTDTVAERLVWREAGEGDERSLILDDDGTVVVSLDGVDDLACPVTEAFPYSYRRDSDDKRFRVRTRDARTVGIYDGVADMRANAYVPLPMPLVPEHVFAGVSSVQDEWAVLVVDSHSNGAGGESVTRLVTAGAY